MVTVKIEKTYGNATVRVSITASSIARALQMAGSGAKLLSSTEQAPVPADDFVREAA